MSRIVTCIWFGDCYTGKNHEELCKKCKHNITRNYIEDHFKEANDNPIPEKCPKIYYNGPIDQTEGYKCPVCGGFTKPHIMKKNLCSCCGYGLNI